jgi:uncharacterized protein YijF (DUF1287 family)
VPEIGTLPPANEAVAPTTLPQAVASDPTLAAARPVGGLAEAPAAGPSPVAAAPPAATLTEAPPIAAVPETLPSLALVPAVPVKEDGRQEVAALDVAPSESAVPPGPVTAPVTAPVGAPMAIAPANPNVCVAEDVPGRAKPVRLAAAVPSLDPEAFGLALAEAAHEQVDDFVVYTDKYQRISYPMGDIPALYGVCTDVIIRAYRAIGYDLQQLVHESRIGSGDTNIDHRRVETLRKFFAKYGEQLPITEFAEDYKPGDIVSYYRPQNRHSRTHIAIVSHVVAPSGRLMIIHNRGWGPQIEDGLFVDEITGHYRYSGAKPVPASAKPAVAQPGKAAPQNRSQPQRKAGSAAVKTSLAGDADGPAKRLP